MDSSQSNPQTKQPNRDYKCPCGKTYLSNAAIFTHIKQKHGGVPPGPIEKPKHQNKPRGRPPLANKNKNQPTQKNAQGTKQNQPKQQTLNNPQYYQAFRQIFVLLAQIYSRVQINPSLWQNVDTFQLLQDFIDTKRKPTNFKFRGVCIGFGISQFLNDVSQGLQNYPWRFQQVLILFILLLQYVIDENNRTQIIEEAPVQFLIDFMNPFIRWHIKDYAEYLKIDQLWIMQEQNMKQVLLCFFNWLKWKNYTQYCVAII